MVSVTLFAQIISKLDRSKFKKLSIAKQTDKHSNGLRSATGNLNHMGVQKAPSKSSVSYQNKHREHTLFKDYYFTVLESLGQQAGFKQVKFRMKSKIFLLDSSTISLCLSIFDWAKYKTHKGAVKLYTLLDYDGNLPAYVNITDGKTADNKGAYDVPLHKGSVIVADRFYNDFHLLNIWDSKDVFFCYQAQRETSIYGRERKYLAGKQVPEHTES